MNTETKYLVAPLTVEILTAPDDLDLSGYGFELTATGLLPTMEPTFKMWQSCGMVLQQEWNEVSRRATKLQFALGDWLNYGEKHYGDDIWNYLDPKDYAYETIRNFMSVARSVAASRRRDGLSFSHHVAVAPLSPEMQNVLLFAAENEHLTVAAITERAHVSRGLPPRDPHTVTCPECGAMFTP